MALNQVTIEKVEGGYIFQANASQNHSQPLGKSAVVYPNFADCSSAMKRFVTLVRTNNLQSADGKHIKIEKENDKFYFRYFDENGCCIFERKSGYTQKVNCIKGIKAVFVAVNNT